MGLLQVSLPSTYPGGVFPLYSVSPLYISSRSLSPLHIHLLYMSMYSYTCKRFIYDIDLRCIPMIYTYISSRSVTRERHMAEMEVAEMEEARRWSRLCHSSRLYIRVYHGAAWRR